MFLNILKSEKLPKELIDCNYFLESLDNTLITEESKNFFQLEQINLLVGANNSGKSRFLRGILQLNKDAGKVQLLETPKLLEDYIESDYVDRFSKTLDSAVNNRRLTYYNEYYGSIHEFCVRAIKKQIQTFDLIENYHTFKEFFNAINSLYQEISHSTIIPIQQTEILKDFCKKIFLLDKNIKFFIENKISNCIYIPTLRSLIKSNFFEVDSFEKTIEQQYDFKGIKIYTGLNLYSEVLQVRNSIKEKREGFERFERFLSKYFFHNVTVEIIADLKEKQLIFYVDGDERKIHDIGDGIQQIILLLFPIFVAENNTWILIEEPETHLHPGLQRIFIETLLKDEYLQNKNLTYFFTTHSNHFLDISIDTKNISIFQFEKQKKGDFLIKSKVNSDSEILDLLGVNTTSVFLANSSLWVEGPTDRKYLSKFIKLYSDKKSNYLKEDIDFAFFEYGGNLIEHYLFDKDFDEDYSEDEVRDKIKSFALSNKIYLLADNDNVDSRTAKGKRRKKFEDIQNANFKYQNTVVVEIENLLPKNLLKEFLKSLVKSNFENIEMIDFEINDYQKIRLGEFFKNLLIENGFSETDLYKFVGESGTLKDDYKKKLCNFVINSDINYKDLIEDNPILQKIVEGLYNFIKTKSEF
jgi:predicted ATP-dependent endonuclease of OLD family